MKSSHKIKSVPVSLQMKILRDLVMRALKKDELDSFPSYLLSYKNGEYYIDRMTEECFTQLSQKEKKAIDDAYNNLADRSRDSRQLYFLSTVNYVPTELKLFFGRNDRDGTISVALRPNYDEAKNVGDKTHDEFNQITLGFMTAAAIVAGNQKKPYYAQLGILGIEGALNKEWNDRNIGWATHFHSVRDFVKAVNAVTPKKARVKLEEETLIEPLDRLYEIQAPPSLAELELKKRAATSARGNRRD